MRAETTTTKNRSPNYPAISLGDAVERVRKIYATQRTYPANREILAQVMGYKGLNGASATVISALSQYGLLEGYGDKLRVSAVGQDLALHRKGDAEYASAVRTAASSPVFFREMQDQYPDGLPSDHSLRAALIKKGFNPNSVDPAIRSYRETHAFVISDTEGVNTLEETQIDQSETREVQATAQAPLAAGSPSILVTGQTAGHTTVYLPYSLRGMAILQASFPLTEEEWGRLELVLQAMKPALTASLNNKRHGEQNDSHELRQDRE